MTIVCGFINTSNGTILQYTGCQLSSHPYLCTCGIRKQSDKNFLSLNPKYEKIILYSYLGGVLGEPYVEPR